MPSTHDESMFLDKQVQSEEDRNVLFIDKTTYDHFMLKHILF